VIAALDSGRRAAGLSGGRRWCARIALALGTLAILVWQLGTGPFVDGLRAVDGAALAAGFALGFLTTACCAWRWRTVATGLGLELPLGAALAFYYRSLFLNLSLPGGVLGDVHRGLSHGRESRELALSLRAVAWERFAGQAVQAALTVGVLLLAPSPVRGAMPLIALALFAALAAAALALRRGFGPARGRWARWRAVLARDLRECLLARDVWPSIALASALVVAGHAATFLVAARATGASAPIGELLPLALLVLAVAALPNVGGWGPREGATAWAFAAAGLGAQAGVATSVAYGVIVLVAALPGAAVLAAGWARRTLPERRPGRRALGTAALAQRQGAPDG
jgi:uncharacterized membrane protein YbhN (UPF0104 family)